MFSGSIRLPQGGTPHVFDEEAQSIVWGSDFLSEPDILGSYFYKMHV